MSNCGLPQENQSRSIDGQSQPLPQSEWLLNCSTNVWYEAGHIQDNRSISKHANIAQGQNPNTLSIEQATLAQSLKIAKQQSEYAPIDFFGEGDDIVNAGGRQPTANDPADGPREYAVYRIVRHIGECFTVQYVVCRLDYIPPVHSVEAPEHISHRSTSPSWRQTKQND